LLHKDACYTVSKIEWKTKSANNPGLLFFQ
jgi:hypothetical protein